jgi:hypothetical protein
MFSSGACLQHAPKTLELPPLILHPFDTATAGPVRLGETISCDDASRAYLEARYSELRMLCFLGKDLDRWLAQCVDCIATEPGLAGSGISESTFITQLLFDPPQAVVRKMNEWGVANFQIIFSRGLGLNAIYSFPPEPRQVSEAFLRDFHQYADALFDARLRKEPAIEPDFAFVFDVYASSEYSKMLENSWLGAPEE